MEACAEVDAPFEAIEVNQPAQDGTSSQLLFYTLKRSLG